uniref:phosphoglycerate mutase (2,3-diphosphoglycerate-dependent) n=1 Tax=Gossypium raimondii TaxID=29730 RepID=A0A0D2TUK3_GOSRA|nr:hypothetical protein B456_009G239400 [Gossypium raimondii]
MANAMLHQTVGTLQLHGSSGIHFQGGNNSVRLVPKGFKVEVGFCKRGICSSGEKKFSVIQASASQTSVFDPVLSPSNNGTHESLKKSNEAALILIHTIKQSIPVIAAWQLNERMYGELQGLNKQETADRFGKEKVHEWRRSYDIPPPNGESLEMCAERAVAYFKDEIEPQLLSGKNVMIAAHGNSLRSIIMYLDKLTSQEVISLELSTGIPMLYIFKEGKFIRRGSPIAPTEAGVYAYTRKLAQYRQKLDEMLH